MANKNKILTDIELKPDEILSTIHDSVDWEIINRILNIFIENGFFYKVRNEYTPRDWVDKPGYRIFCYIKKSKEALIINIKGWHNNSVCLQIRILNNDTFKKLDEYSETIRNSILNAIDCHNCGSEGCSKLAYIFSYKNNNYKKCHSLTNVFTFRNLLAKDISSIIDIIINEINFSKPNRN